MPDPKYRQDVLEHLLAVMRQDERLTGAVLVGSGAVGFLDAESDIDLVAVVHPNSNPAVVYEDWATIVPRHARVLHRLESGFGLAHWLHCFVLNGYLEVDLSFIGVTALRATREHWRVLFDRTGVVEERMVSSRIPTTDVATEYRWTLNTACFTILQCGKALRRGRTWQAAVLLDELRVFVLRLACLEHFGVTNVERNADRLPSALLAAVATTLAAVEPEAQAAALRRTVDVVLERAEALDRCLGLAHRSSVATWLPGSIGYSRMVADGDG